MTFQEQKEENILHIEQRNYNSIFNNFGNQECDLLALPEEIIEKIILYSTPDQDLNMKQYFDMRLTCRKFHRIMYSKLFCKKLLIKFNMYDSFKTKFEHTDEICNRIFTNISFEYIFNIFKRFMERIIGLQLIKSVGGFLEYFKLPYINECINRAV